MNIQISCSQQDPIITAKAAEGHSDLVYIVLGDTYAFLTRAEAERLLNALTPVLTELEATVPIPA